MMPPIRTARLTLVPATLAHAEAELESPAALGALLQAAVPASWPFGEHDRSAMEFFRTQLSEGADAVGWYGWYALHSRGGMAAPVLIGTAGYLGPPGADGVVEIGYSVAPEHQRNGFATEMAQALVERACAMPTVTRIRAHTAAPNVPSARVLKHCGFQLVGPGSEAGTVLYERALSAPCQRRPAARSPCTGRDSSP